MYDVRTLQEERGVSRRKKGHATEDAKDTRHSACGKERPSAAHGGGGGRLNPRKKGKIAKTTAREKWNASGEGWEETGGKVPGSPE